MSISAQKIAATRKACAKPNLFGECGGKALGLRNLLGAQARGFKA